jgi:Flp pilus assembly protein CpaB
MRRGGRILVILGLFLGLLTALGTFVVLSQASTQTQRVDVQQVVVATQSIGGRTEIQAGQIGLLEWPTNAIPQGGVFTSVDQVAGQIALYPIAPGQLILPSMLISKQGATQTKTLASILVPEGKVLVSYGVSAQGGVAGAVQPGDYVDMMLTLAPTLPSTTTTTATTRPTTALTGLEGLPVTQLFLQNVLVVHVGNWPSGTAQEQQEGNTGMMTFALDRQDALTLKSASEQAGGDGSIWLVLRRVGDNKPASAEGVTLQYLNKRFNFNLVPAVNR